MAESQVQEQPTEDLSQATQETPTLPDGGVKGVKSARLDLLPYDSLWQIALIYGFGAQKYAERNWEHGYEYSKSFGALQRHLALWFHGEENDAESGLPHLAHAGWHILALLAFTGREIGTDDRPKVPIALQKMVAELTNPEIFLNLKPGEIRDRGDGTFDVNQLGVSKNRTHPRDYPEAVIHDSSWDPRQMTLEEA